MEIENVQVNDIVKVKDGAEHEGCAGLINAIDAAGEVATVKLDLLPAPVDVLVADLEFLGR